MKKGLDGEGPQRVEWTQQVTRQVSTKPVNDVSFTENHEGLQRDRWGTDRWETDGWGTDKYETGKRPCVIGRRDLDPPMGCWEAEVAGPHRLRGGTFQSPGEQLVWAGFSELPRLHTGPSRHAVDQRYRVHLLVISYWQLKVWSVPIYPSTSFAPLPQLHVAVGLPVRPSWSVWRHPYPQVAAETPCCHPAVLPGSCCHLAAGFYGENRGGILMFWSDHHETG